MYTVVGSRTNRTFRVLWALEELGIEYDHKPYSVRSPEALEHSPTGKLPALIAEGEVITDSAAIITFLADRHGGLTFPAGSVQRAKQDALLHRVNDEIDAVLWTAARHSFICRGERVPAVKESLKLEFARSLDRLMEQIEAPI